MNDWTKTVPRRTSNGKQEPEKRNMTDFYREQIEEMSLSNQYAQLTNVMRPQQPQQQQEQQRPWTEMAEFANAMGMNVSNISDQRSQELERATRALSDMENQVQTMRAQQLETLNQRLIDAANKLEEASNHKKEEAPTGLRATVDNVLESHVSGILDNAFGGNGNSNHNEDPISVLSNQVQGVENLKNLLGVNQQAPVQNGNLSADLTRVILEHERQKLKDTQDAEKGGSMNRAIEGIVGWLQGNVDKDVIKSLIPTRKEKTQPQPQYQAPPQYQPPPQQPQQPSAMLVSCAKEGCGGTIEMIEGQASVECPSCHTVYNLEEKGEETGNE